jgi:DNA polymerase-3 subunit gamma/tau
MGRAELHGAPRHAIAKPARRRRSAATAAWACQRPPSPIIVDVDYLVIARKYRPQTFTEVAGQEVVARTLTNAIKSQRVAHAYLFTGPRGVGKTSMARILAKALCCETGPTTEPCGVCQHCRMITDSGHPDVAEIDAARYNGVDAIRELSDNANFSPSLARFRIYILDEVHMLSTSAWNALLKLLEEPPAHVRFIFATTEVDKVLATVLSRCQRFDFRSIDLDNIVKRLRDICAKEEVKLADAVLFRIARAAGGGMRDAQTLLDQLIAVSEGEVIEEDLNLLLGAARGGDLELVVNELLSSNASAAIETLDRIIAGGVAPATFLDQLIDHVRTVLLVQACGPESPAVKRLGTCTPAVVAQAKLATPEKTMRTCQILIASQQSLRQGADPRLLLELSFVRIAGLGQMLDADTLLRRIERLEMVPAGASAPHPR